MSKAPTSSNETLNQTFYERSYPDVDGIRANRLDEPFAERHGAADTSRRFHRAITGRSAEARGPETTKVVLPDPESKTPFEEDHPCRAAGNRTLWGSPWQGG